MDAMWQWTIYGIIDIGVDDMEKFYFEIPSMKRKKEAIEYIEENYKNNSSLNGTGGLHRYLDNYEGWLEKLEKDYNMIPSEERVPARTYFLIRENDDRIIGMINIRTALNEQLSKSGGHIGYGIRPSERGKGYNKINLYLGLKVCNEYGIDKVFMDAALNNPASWKTMEALGGERVKQYYNEEDQCEFVDYNIDVKKSIETYKDIYEPYVATNIYLTPYTDIDYEFVYEVKKNAYKKYVEWCWGTWNEEDQRKYFEKFITTVKDNAFIIMNGYKKIGFYNGEILENGNYEIGNICITPEYQGKGIGTKILQEKIAENKDRDIEIQYFKQNPVGSLYTKLGFVPNGETESHYQMIKPKQNTLKK